MVTITGGIKIRLQEELVEKRNTAGQICYSSVIPQPGNFPKSRVINHRTLTPRGISRSVTQPNAREGNRFA